MARATANISEETRALLNEIKREYSFKSDDQLIKYLSEVFKQSNEAAVLQHYLKVIGKAEAGA